MMSKKEVNVTRLSKQPVLRGNTRIRVCRFWVQALITAKETILHEEFCELAGMPDFMMSGNSYLLSKEYNISNSIKNSPILCQPDK